MSNTFITKSKQYLALKLNEGTIRTKRAGTNKKADYAKTHRILSFMHNLVNFKGSVINNRHNRKIFN